MSQSDEHRLELRGGRGASADRRVAGLEAEFEIRRCDLSNDRVRPLFNLGFAQRQHLKDRGLRWGFVSLVRDQCRFERGEPEFVTAQRTIKRMLAQSLHNLLPAGDQSGLRRAK